MSNFQSLKSTRNARQKSSVQNSAGRIAHEEGIGPDTNASRSRERQAIEQSRENSCVRSDKDDKVLEEDTQEPGSMPTLAPTAPTAPRAPTAPTAPRAPTAAVDTTKAEQVLGVKSKLTKLYEKELNGVSIEIRDIPGRGRGLVSTKSVKPGQSIYPLATSPYLVHN